MNLNPTQLQEIAQIMATASGASKVILFGSRARGDFDSSSDWDFLLVMPQNWNPSCLDQELDAARAAHNALFKQGFNFSIDIIPMTNNAFISGNNVLARMVWREGITLFGIEECQKPESMNWQSWIEFAEENFQVALENQETRGSTAVMLAHQAVEKYLKAVLIARGELPERSHDLVLLLRTIEPNPTEELTKAARDLNYFLPRARYPNERYKLDAEAVSNAIQYAKLFRALARERLGLENL
jgi:HEPN domain-containing protein